MNIRQTPHEHSEMTKLTWLSLTVSTQRCSCISITQMLRVYFQEEAYYSTFCNWWNCHVNCRSRAGQLYNWHSVRNKQHHWTVTHCYVNVRPCSYHYIETVRLQQTCRYEKSSIIPCAFSQQVCYGDRCVNILYYMHYFLHNNLTQEKQS